MNTSFRLATLDGLSLITLSSQENPIRSSSAVLPMFQSRQITTLTILSCLSLDFLFVTSYSICFRPTCYCRSYVRANYHNCISTRQKLKKNEGFTFLSLSVSSIAPSDDTKDSSRKKGRSIKSVTPRSIAVQALMEPPSSSNNSFKSHDHQKPPHITVSQPTCIDQQ